MKMVLSVLGLFTAVISTSLLADEVQLSCFYTEVTYDAPFMAEPSTRQCPEKRCSYDIAWDTDTGSAVVNGLAYQMSADAERVLLSREALNPVMGGVDKASFSVAVESMEFRAIRHSAPNVKLTFAGQCVAR